MRIRDAMRLAVLSVLYVATAQMGLALDVVHGFAVAVWPPTGIALAALVLYGPRLWPCIAVSAFLVNWWAGAPLLVAGGMALGNALEALLGTLLLRRCSGFVSRWVASGTLWASSCWPRGSVPWSAPPWG